MFQWWSRGLNQLGLGLNWLRVMGILAWAELVVRLVGVHGYFGASSMGKATSIIAAPISLFFGGCLF